MKIRHYILLLLAAAATFTACEDQTLDVATTPTDEVAASTYDERKLPAPVAFQFRQTTSHLTDGYVQTIQRAAGAYEHHLVLTASDVLENDDLAGGTDAALVVTFATPTSSLVGTHRLGGADANIRTVGMRHYPNFSDPYLQIDNAWFYQRGEIIIRERFGVYSVVVALDGFYEDNAELNGVFVGELYRVAAPADVNPVTEADFTGESQVAIGGISVGEITRAYARRYDMGNGEYMVDGLYFTRTAVDAEGELVGSSDALVVSLENTQLRTGRYLSWSAPSEGRYFERRSVAEQRMGGAWCTNMNFVTGSWDDDDPVDGGETLVRVDGDNVQFRMTGEILYGASFTLEYNGPITYVNQ